jgi:hypothetical protein
MNPRLFKTLDDTQLPKSEISGSTSGGVKASIPTLLGCDVVSLDEYLAFQSITVFKFRVKKSKKLILEDEETTSLGNAGYYSPNTGYYSPNAGYYSPKDTKSHPRRLHVSNTFGKLCCLHVQCRGAGIKSRRPSNMRA